MQIITLILCFISLVVTLVCIFMISNIKKQIDDFKKEDMSDNTRNDIYDLKNTISGEFSRNRTERSSADKDQRDEISRRFAEMYDRVDKLKDANTKGLQSLSNQVSIQLQNIRDNSAAQSEKQMVKMAESLEKIRESNEKKLDEMRSVVDEKLTSTLTERLDTSFKTVSEQLEHLYSSLGEMKEMSGGITENVSSLNRVLTNVKARGTWAEVQLKNILDQTIPTMYVENFAADEKTRERVEFAVKIPSSDGVTPPAYLPIDSKFPMEDYIRLCDASDKGDSEALSKARKNLEDRVIAEAKDIKKYIKVPKTTPFAIMYLASEGLYAEIASSPNAVIEKLQTSYNIMVAGPTTITALLNSLAMGFKIAAINEKANEVRLLLSAIKTQYETFDSLLIKAKKRIDDAGKSLEDAQHRNNMIHKKLKSVEELDLERSDSLLSIGNDSNDRDEI